MRGFILISKDNIPFADRPAFLIIYGVADDGNFNDSSRGDRGEILTLKAATNPYSHRTCPLDVEL